MSDERLTLAIGRIERAVARLEDARHAAARAAPPPPDAALAQRHEALRGDMRDAVARLDALLDTLPAADADLLSRTGTDVPQ